MKTEDHVIGNNNDHVKMSANVQALNLDADNTMPDFSLEKLDDLQKDIKAKIPFDKDEYAKLRYIPLFIKNHLQPENLETPPYQLNAIFNSELLEALSRGHSRNKLNGNQSEGTFGDILNHTAILKGLMKNGVALGYAELLENLGQNTYINALVRDCIRIKLTDHDHRDDFQHAARRKILNPATEPEPIIVLLDISAEHKLATLSEKETVVLAKRWHRDTEIQLAIYRYVGELEMTGLIPYLHQKLRKLGSLSPAVQLGLLELLGQIGNEESWQLLENHVFGPRRPEFPSYQLANLITYRALLSQIEIIRHLLPVAAEPKKQPELAHFLFQGDPDDAGKGNSVGLSVFLKQLGDAVSQEPDWERVYTIVLYPFNEHTPEKSLIDFSTAGQLILQIPFYCQGTFDDSHMLRNEYAIQRAVRRMMEAHDIDPDVYHIRFSNNASRAVASLAKALGKKSIFTLPPYPRIKYSDTRGKPHSFGVNEALSNLNKVNILDSILEEADGILGIGFPAGNIDVAVKNAGVGVTGLEKTNLNSQ